MWKPTYFFTGNAHPLSPCPGSNIHEIIIDMCTFDLLKKIEKKVYGQQYGQQTLFGVGVRVKLIISLLIISVDEIIRTIESLTNKPRN